MVTSDSLWPHLLQHSTLLRPPLSPGVCSSLCPVSWWCYITIYSFATTSPFVFNLSQRVCSSHLVAKVSELQHQAFQWISGLISFRIDCFHHCAVQGTQKSSPAQFKSISSSVLSLLNEPSLTSVHRLYGPLLAKCCLFLIRFLDLS